MASNFTALVCPTTECFSPGSQSASLGEKPFAWRLHAVAVFAFASAVWSYSVVRPQPAGLRRFLAAAPLVLCHFLIPFLLDRNEDIISLVTLTFSLTWLSSFKVLQLCANRGPLTKDWSFPHFLAIYLLPVLPYSGDAGKDGKEGLLATTERGRVMRYHGLCLLGDLIGLAIASAVLLTRSLDGWPLQWFLVECFYTFGLYKLFSGIMDFVCIPAAAMGLRLSPHFYHPYFSASFGELWSKRWNLTAGTVLRNSVYDPIIEGRLVHNPKLPPAPRSLLRYVSAICATFLTSGIMHEVVFWYMRRFDPTSTGRWLVFFAGCGPICVLEGALLGVLKRKRLMPPIYLSIFLTLLFGMLWGHMFFFPPVINSGLAMDVVSAVGASLSSAVQSWSHRLTA